MGVSIITFLIIFSILSLGLKVSVAQEIPFTPRDNAIFGAFNQLKVKEGATGKLRAPLASRENIIFTTLNQLEEKEEAKEEAIQEAIREAKEKVGKGEEGIFFVEEKRKGFSFKDLASRSHPYLNIQTSFDDNLGSAADEKKSGSTYTTTPGLKINFPGRFRSLNLDINIDNEYHQHRPQENTQNIDIGLLSTFSIRRYILSISDDYFSNYIATPELGIKKDQFVYYWKNAFGLILGRHFNRIGFDAGYKRTDLNYEYDSRSSSRITETFSLNEYLRIATKTRLSMEYSYSRTKYTLEPDPNDSHVNDVSLRLSSALSPKITASTRMGYGLTDNKTSADSRNTTLTENLGYKVSHRSDLALGFMHVIHEEATKLNYYVRNNFTLSGNHRLAFNPKLGLSFSSGVDYYDYPKKEVSPNPKKDATYTVRLGLSYTFRAWLDFSLDWTHTKSKSNIDIDYHKNVVTFKTEAKF